ncbi:MAG TPA: DUF4038 domain-containing protein [Puia sp.]|nr:DUF4038 domain-containing protein [Puia sp.]
MLITIGVAVILLFPQREKAAVFQKGPARLRVSANGHFLMTDSGQPFFWLGDTGWLLLTRLTRDQTEQYLEDRRKKRFTVIQIMVVHGIHDVDAEGDSALAGGNLATPKTSGSDYWDRLDDIVDRAGKKGMYVALVPVWGGVVKSARPTVGQAAAYAAFLAKRYRDKPNIVWMNGGDIKGSDYRAVWDTIGATLKQLDPAHLITFHPRGRTSSSTWFQHASWLDFNSVQSGHRSYAQDTSGGDPHYGEDNWRYIAADYAKTPAKPVLDAEPSYENIPHGLHDTSQPRWTDADVRRYGYWSVFAGACGFTYGDNSVMQMLRPTDKGSAYGAREPWFRAIDDPGAEEMGYLRVLMLSRPYFDRVPDESMVTGQGKRYDYVAATRGKGYAFFYTYTGRTLTVSAAPLHSDQVTASWFNPRDGSWKAIGQYSGRKLLRFDPPGRPAPGNDWVLVVDAAPWALDPAKVEKRRKGEGADAGMAAGKKDIYLFTSFREPATDGLYFLYSLDGYHWTDLGGSWLRPGIGDKKIMRDPSIAQGPDGTWRLVWTCGWNGDKGFGYASTKDLIHWSKERFIPVMANEPDAFNVWAPELFFEKDSAQFLIVWATTIPYRFPRGQEDERNNHRLYCTTTKDFVSFTPARLFFDPGYSVIDPTIVQRGAHDFVLVFKDNTRQQRDIKVAFSDRAAGPYHDDSMAFTPEYTEGPTVAKVGSDWLIYFDSYRARRYGAVRTGDFKNFSDVTDSVEVPMFHKHGTIVMTDGPTIKRLIHE